MSDLSSLSGEKRKLDFEAVRAVFDPERTFGLSGSEFLGLWSDCGQWDLRAQKNRIFGCIVASLVARTAAVFH